MNQQDKHALVSKINRAYEKVENNFQCDGVFIFESKEEAIIEACEIILKYDNNTKCIDGNKFYIGKCEFNSCEHFLTSWQEDLESDEIFHVMPIIDYLP